MLHGKLDDLARNRRNANASKIVFMYSIGKN